MEILPAGDQALLVQLGDDVTAEELHAAAARARAQPGVVAVIVGHSSLYVIGGTSVPRYLGTSGVARVPGVTHRVRVCFDGADFEEFLAHAHVTRAAFFARVAGLRLTARYLGFRAGFAYLDGWPTEWAMPRRATSRPVLRGSFAVAGNVAGFYPIDTPGGWNLLGRTDFDFEHALSPGDGIVIEPVDTPLAPPLRANASPWRMEGVEVISAPLATLVGAPDWSRVERGLSPGGAFDDVAASMFEMPVIECAMVWPELRFTSSMSSCTPELRVLKEMPRGRIEGGLRGYVGMHVRDERRGNDRHVIHAMRGPHDIGLTEVDCEVTPQLDRVGIRLKTTLNVDVPRDLKSIGMQCGTVQLHPDGSLVAMGPDHPVTGGYLQPMTVLSSERWKLAQLVPGERVKLVAVQPP